MLEFIQKYYLWIAAVSAVMFVGGIIALPIIVVRLPEDYFVRKRRSLLSNNAHPALRLFVLVVRNILGAIILVLGIIMLVTPGQGIMSIMVGLMLLTFPGKRELERWLISFPSVIKPINALRAKYGKPPLKL